LLVRDRNRVCYISFCPEFLVPNSCPKFIGNLMARDPVDHLAQSCRSTTDIATRATSAMTPKLASLIGRPAMWRGVLASLLGSDSARACALPVTLCRGARPPRLSARISANSSGLLSIFVLFRDADLRPFGPLQLLPGRAGPIGHWSHQQCVRARAGILPEQVQ
jgi:hypothetical protein